MADYLFEQLPEVMYGVSRITEQRARKILGTTARAFGREVAANTPVDVGDARSNWVLNVGTLSSEKPNAYSPYKKLGSAQATLSAGRFGDIPNLAGAVSDHNAALAYFEATPGATVLVFNNNTPYIVPLDEGRLYKRGGGTSQSLQVAPGFIDRALKFAVERGLVVQLLPRSQGGGPQFASFNIRTRRP